MRKSKTPLQATEYQNCNAVSSRILELCGIFGTGIRDR